MNALIAATMLLTSGVSAASFGDAANSVYSAAKDMNSKVNAWSPKDGIQGALSIQDGFPNLSSALGVLSEAVVGAKASDIDAEANHHSMTELSSLLQALTSKASDFAAISITPIVTKDLEDMNKPAGDIINGLIKAAGEDSAKWGLISSDINDIESNVNVANKAYGIGEIHFSPAPSGSAKAESTSSAKETESASSAKESKESKETGSSASGSAMASSSKPCAHKSGSMKNSTSNATESHKHEDNHPSQSMPSVKNAGAIASVGVCGVAAGVIAMLL